MNKTVTWPGIFRVDYKTSIAYNKKQKYIEIYEKGGENKCNLWRDL